MSYDKISEKISCSTQNDDSHTIDEGSIAMNTFNIMLTTALEGKKHSLEKDIIKQKKIMVKRIPKSKNENQLPTKINFNSHIKSYRIINSNLNLKEEEQLQSMSEEISLDSHKTDCEDTKSSYKYKIQITPLDRICLFHILKDYFVEYKMQNESDFFFKLFNGELFNYHEKTTKIVKNHYMRKRVCYKIYKVFEKLVRIIKLIHFNQFSSAMNH